MGMKIHDIVTALALSRRASGDHDQLAKQVFQVGEAVNPMNAATVLIIDAMRPRAGLRFRMCC